MVHLLSKRGTLSIRQNWILRVGYVSSPLIRDFFPDNEAENIKLLFLVMEKLLTKFTYLI